MYKKACFLSLISLVSANGHSPGYCQGLCEETHECKVDKHGSYCKSWQDPPVCFGLYHKKPHGYCFEPNDPLCNDAKLEPVRCGHKPEPKSRCQELCDKVESCRNDPHAHGSYCKTWQDKEVCFGLYHTKHGGYCFEPNDPHCNDAKLEPVKCGKYH